MIGTIQALLEVLGERGSQDRKWGPAPDNFLDRPDGTALWGNDNFVMARRAQRQTDQAAKDGTLTWAHILTEEYWEALAETDPEKLRAELIQVAAVAVSWIETIDARTES